MKEENLRRVSSKIIVSNNINNNSNNNWRLIYMASTKQKPDYWLSTDGLLKIQSWASDGYTNEQIAEKIGICERKFYMWLKLKPHPEESDLPHRQIAEFATLAEFVAHARTSVEEVEASLKMCAMGYWVEEEYLNKKGEVKKYRRYIPPSDKAQQLYLRNQAKKKWTRDTEKEIDTTALDRLDAILGSLTQSAVEEDEEEEQETITPESTEHEEV